MSKRSHTTEAGPRKKRPKDFYPTFDPRAFHALAPHLPNEFTYAEPCYGEGDLHRGMQEHIPNGTCVFKSDVIEYQPDELDFHGSALSLLDNSFHWLDRADLFITNPPWTREVLHSLILHLSDLKPTWLLFDADWAHTAQSAPYMRRCLKIVSVGRLKFMRDSDIEPGKKNTDGFDNCAWYLFDREINVIRTQFVPRMEKCT